MISIDLKVKSYLYNNGWRNRDYFILDKWQISGYSQESHHTVRLWRGIADGT